MIRETPMRVKLPVELHFAFASKARGFALAFALKGRGFSRADKCHELTGL
jgi:hypothetical protein